MTTADTVAAIYLDGNDTRLGESSGELDEAIAEEQPNSAGITPSRFIYRYLQHKLHQSDTVDIQRLQIEAEDDWETVGKSDEVLVWLKTHNVKLSQQTCTVLEADGQVFVIRPASAEQRLTLQFEGLEAPQGIGEGFDGPLRVDGNASRDKDLEKTAIDDLYLFGTPQFRARTLEQLELLAAYPSLGRLLDTARRRYTTMPRIVIMQLYAGPPQYGPGFVLYVDNAQALAEGYTVALYDPYAAEGLDALTVLVRMLQDVYGALATDAIIPGIPLGE